MNKRILITSTDLMMVQFLVPHVQNLTQNGYEVEIACSDVGGRMEEIREKLRGCVRVIHTVRLKRSPLAPVNTLGYGDMRRIIDAGHFDLIWTNEPVMGVVTRLASQKARKSGTKVLYMVHGFHFFDGAPKANWLLFYPVEKAMASKADVIATVNHEDYRRALSMGARKVAYIHGIGINTDRMDQAAEGGSIRSELGLSADDFIVLSVGELNRNKNHAAMIRALERLQDPHVHYVVCGKGDQLDALLQQATEAGLQGQVHFLGYRQDIPAICRQADMFAMPSYREGLPVASLEAMYCGLPLVASKIRGLTDIVENGRSGFLCDPDDAEAFADAIAALLRDPALRSEMAAVNRERVVPYCLKNTKREVLALLSDLE